MEDIKVSVICTAYNHAKFIREALESIVTQKTDFKFEVIVHDDASTDNTAEIIQEYAEKYPEIIKPIYQLENQHSKKLPRQVIGTFIMPKVRGEYVAFCEGDDYWCDDTKLQQQFDAIDNDKDITLCVHRVQCINEDGSKRAQTRPVFNKAIFKTGKMKNNDALTALFLISDNYPFQTSSYFVRKEIIDKVYDYTNCGETFSTPDMLILYFSLAFGKYYYIDKTMSCYRMFVKNSWSSTIRDMSDKNEIVKYRENLIYGKKKIDEYTEYKFHHYFEIGRFKDILSLCNTDVTNTKRILKRENFEKSVIKEALNSMPKWYSYKYFLCVKFPLILKLWYKLRGVS